MMNEISIRLTVDTMDDFKLAQKIYRAVGEKHWGYIYKHVMNKPQILKEMKKNMRDNQK